MNAAQQNDATVAGDFAMWPGPDRCPATAVPTRSENPTCSKHMLPPSHE